MRRWLLGAICAFPGFACREAPSPGPDRLVLAAETSAVTFDPHAHAHWTTASVLDHFYDALVAFGPEMKVRPRLAERWENPSENVWRFHLRPGVVFHDGRPLGAEDVVASLVRAMRPDCPVRYYLHPVTEVRVAGDLLVDIVTRAPSPALLNKLTYVSIVPRDTGASIAMPVGTGPYRFLSGQPGGTIEGQRFDRFWGARPYFNTVSFKPVPDRGQRAEAIVRGQADIVCQFPSERWHWGLRQPPMAVRSVPGLSVVMLTFSAAKGRPFADRRLRRAVGLAIDRKRLVDEGLLGLGTSCDQFVPPVVTGHATDLPRLATDLEQAHRLVREAGFQRGLALPVTAVEPYEALVRVLGRQLGAIGIRLEPRLLPQAAFYQALTREELPAAVFAWAAETGDASATFDPLFHSPVGGFGSFNRFHYVNPALDAQIELADQVAAPRDRLGRFAEAAQILREDAPAIPLAVVADLYAVRVGLAWDLPIHRFFRLEAARPTDR